MIGLFEESRGLDELVQLCLEELALDRVSDLIQGVLYCILNVYLQL